jgi:hypothetical protein
MQRHDAGLRQPFANNRERFCADLGLVQSRELVLTRMNAQTVTLGIPIVSLLAISFASHCAAMRCRGSSALYAYSSTFASIMVIGAVRPRAGQR